MVTVRNPTPKLSDELYKAMQRVLDALYAARDDEDNDISGPFHALLPKREWADYYKLIKKPQALNLVLNAVKRKNYTAFADFVRDCAQIFHNAKLFNRHDSPIYADAVTLEGILTAELKALSEAGTVSAVDATLPDLGPLPPPSPTPSQMEGTPDPEEDSAAEDEEDEDEEDEDEDEDEEASDGKRRRTSKRSTKMTTRSSRSDKAKGRESPEPGENQKAKDDPRRKRGRPPRVDTPMEIRIKNVLKSLRKFKDEGTGQLKIGAFEKLPEKKEFPEYFMEIKNPMALDQIRKSVKRREYKSMEQFVADMELMFENAKTFNEDDSQLHQDAVLLQSEMRKSVATESAKKDEELGGEEGGKNTKLPLDKIEHKGETYRVGDWIHIVNPNDPNKPTVAQIFRTWKDADGQIWINACWYYRPEQTVHWVEKKFYPEEVVKTGQYRDHQIDEVLGKCFVMFFTRYSKGRPKGVDDTKTPVYVCESRYNELEKHFNKIKTWKSCIPDEVRGQDYELANFDKPRTLKKMPSPIAHLLPPNAKEGDPLPEAKMGVENAPPILGAVFKRARRENDSPPPEPTPPPPPAIPTPKPAPTRANPDYHETMSMTHLYKSGLSAAAAMSPAPPPSQPTRGAPEAPRSTPSSAYGMPPALHHHASSAYNAAQHAQAQIMNMKAQQQQYAPPAPPTTFTLPESVTAGIPDHVADRFMRDSHGNLLFFSIPPLVADAGAPPGAVGHSAAYLARRAEIEERRKRRKDEVGRELEEKRRRVAGEREAERKRAQASLVDALNILAGK